MKDNKDKYIWYVCYGSNLCLERFMKYINGCRDKNPPIDTRFLTINYEMYFGNHSRTWGDGGVCFIKTRIDSNIQTIARAYLVTYQQYKDIQKQEGNSDNWYGNEIPLDPIDGVPAKTFTSAYTHTFNEPIDNYVDVVKKGLQECGLNEKEADDYLSPKLNHKQLEMSWEYEVGKDGKIFRRVKLSDKQ